VRLWINGRLAWPLVFTIVGFSFWLLALDYLYRTVTIPFSLLLICAVAVGLVLILAGFVATKLARAALVPRR
jgi:hypothetical protein